MEVGGWRLEVGGWRLEVGGWRLEVGGWRLEAGGWRLEVIDIVSYSRFHIVALVSIPGKFVVHVEVLYNLYHDDSTGLVQLI